MGTSNVAPEALVRAFRSAQEGRADDGWPALRSFLRFMEGSSNYVGLCKAALALDGLDVGEVRAPYLMPDECEREALTGHLAALRTAFAPASASS